MKKRLSDPKFGRTNRLGTTNGRITLEMSYCPRYLSYGTMLIKELKLPKICAFVK
jgi:hypothetical protein